jgi:hypothetical protein
MADLPGVLPSIQIATRRSGAARHHSIPDSRFPIPEPRGEDF